MSYGNFVDNYPLKNNSSSIIPIALEFQQYRDKNSWREFGSDGEFFREHELDEWLQEKYKPLVLSQRWSVFMESFNQRMESFTRLIESRGIDLNRDVEQHHQVEGPLDSEEQFANNALIISSLPSRICRKDFEAVFSSLTGFNYAACTEPIATRGFTSIGWIFFDSKENAEAALNSISVCEVCL
jgi:hypothetical protein